MSVVAHADDVESCFVSKTLLLFFFDVSLFLFSDVSEYPHYLLTKGGSEGGSTFLSTSTYRRLAHLFCDTLYLERVTK